MATLILFAVLAVIYVAFLIWYSGSGKPLSKQEVQRYISILEKRSTGRGEAAENSTRAFHKFALEDDGKQFFMCNLVKYRDKAQYNDGDRGLTSRAANMRYVRNTAPMLLKRACHPYGIFKPMLNLRKADEYWDEFVVVRYRSRRDVLNMITSDKWYEGLGDKQAGLSENPNMPGKPVIAFPIIPIIVFTILLIIGFIGMAFLYFRP